MGQYWPKPWRAPVPWRRRILMQTLLARSSIAFRTLGQSLAIAMTAEGDCSPPRSNGVSACRRIGVSANSERQMDGNGVKNEPYHQASTRQIPHFHTSSYLCVLCVSVSRGEIPPPCPPSLRALKPAVRPALSRCLAALRKRNRKPLRNH
jgi:hypothetical protein